MSTRTKDEGLYDYALREPRLPAQENRDNDKIAIPIEARLDMYEMQQLLRQFEKRAYDMFLQNLVKGTSHLSLGQEAVATGFGRPRPHAGPGGRPR
jgi:pyruvate dehydrogenase E1 component alpha subunit